MKTKTHMDNDEKPEVIFILSVDTEEEWDWSGPFPNENFSVANINEIPAFHAFCHEFSIKPTYFVDYAVANNPYAAQIMKNLNPKTCEIGAHLHPWANPPFYDETSEAASHVVNLPIEHVKEKLKALTQKIIENINACPTAFRTGRWGINGDILKLLQNEGFKTDSSVYPLYHNDFFSCENASPLPYWPDLTDTNIEGTQNKIYEIPVTVGFNRTHYTCWQKLHKLFLKAPFTWLRVNGILWQTHILRKLYLSPELCTARDMNTLVKVGLKKEQKVFHMYLHSSSLIENITGLSDEINARENICKRIQHVVENLQKTHRIKFCTISEARKLFVNNSEQGSHS